LSTNECVFHVTVDLISTKPSFLGQPPHLQPTKMNDFTILHETNVHVNKS